MSKIGELGVITSRDDTMEDGRGGGGNRGERLRYDEEQDQMALKTQNPWDRAPDKGDKLQDFLWGAVKLMVSGWSPAGARCSAGHHAQTRCIVVWC